MLRGGTWGQPLEAILLGPGSGAQAEVRMSLGQWRLMVRPPPWGQVLTTLAPALRQRGHGALGNLLLGHGATVSPPLTVLRV